MLRGEEERGLLELLARFAGRTPARPRSFPSHLDPPAAPHYFARMTSRLLELRGNFVGSEDEARSFIATWSDEARVRLTEDAIRTEFTFAAPAPSNLRWLFGRLREEGFVLTPASQKELDDATRGHGRGEMLAKLFLAVQDAYGCVTLGQASPRDYAPLDERALSRTDDGKASGPRYCGKCGSFVDRLCNPQMPEELEDRARSVPQLS